MTKSYLTLLVEKGTSDNFKITIKRWIKGVSYEPYHFDIREIEGEITFLHDKARED
jgi:hypothetical protein